MKKLVVKLENCYGIRELDAEFNFDKGGACALYAPNGAMKSSLALTFQDIAQNLSSKDRIFTSRQTSRKVTDEKGLDLVPEQIFVIQPYDQQFGHTEKTSTLLVDNVLRQEYERLFADISDCKLKFLKAMKEQTKSKRDLESEISLTFANSSDELFRALRRVREEVAEPQDFDFSSEPYDLIFDDKVLEFLKTKDFRTLLKSYIERYNELLEASTYFKRGVFTYYNAEQIAQILAKNGFFNAKHSIILNSEVKKEINTVKDLQGLIENEREQITQDPDLRKRYEEIREKIHKNENLRKFQEYLQNNEQILPLLANPEKLKEEIWKSCIRAHFSLYTELLEKYDSVAKRRREIEEAASKQRTQWEEVVDIFNERFSVPFKLVVQNREAVMLGAEGIANLSFEFDDGHASAPVDRNTLLQALSTGEKKALYVLNILFEVEARKKMSQPTLFVVDDIADSFDYRNKYAIIEYLRDISEETSSRQLILTHNFDFFRTIESRFVPYSQCKMAFKTSGGIVLAQAKGIKNVFVNDWKEEFFKNKKKKVASIAFIRNMIEFTKGDLNSDYCLLTSLLHWKTDTEQIRVKQLDDIFNRLFGTSEVSADDSRPVFELIFEVANECLTEPEGANLENKVILAIAIRLWAERFMVNEINDSSKVSAIKSTQTPALVSLFKSKFPGKASELKILHRVLLMTPESIHLNSFMYEPILDMSDEHLRKLLSDISSAFPLN